MVRRLIEQQQIRLAKQELSQCNTATLTTGELGDVRISRRTTQCIHGLLNLGIELPCICSVNLLLQSGHLFHELVGVIGRHLLGDFLIPLTNLEDFAHALFHVLTNVLFFV